MDSIAINKSIRDISGDIAVITFEKVFSGEEFKTFVLSSLKQSIEGIDPPEKETNILLILKSVLEQSIDSPYKIDVDSKIYSIVSTYLATFFPYIG